MKKYISLTNIESIKLQSVLQEIEGRMDQFKTGLDNNCDYGVIDICLISDKPHANQLPTITIKSMMDFDVAESIMIKLCDILNINHFKIIVNEKQNNEVCVTVHHGASLNQARWLAAHNYPNYDIFDAIMCTIEEYNENIEQLDMCTQCPSGEPEDMCTQCSYYDNETLDEGVFAEPAAKIPNLEEVTIDIQDIDLTNA